MSGAGGVGGAEPPRSQARDIGRILPFPGIGSRSLEPQGIDADDLSTARCWAEVDLGALRRNVRALRAATGRPVLAVVKADAYGHGAVPCGRAALEAGARGLAVATGSEALSLKAALGRSAPVLVLGALLEPEIRPVLQSGASVSVHAPADVDRIARVARTLGTVARVHVEVDLGLRRNGARPSEARAVVEKAAETPGVRLDALMGHLPCASDRAATLEALAPFAALVADVRRVAPEAVVHVAASTASFLHEEARFDMIRPGIALHGIDPDGAARKTGVELEPVLSLRARIVRVRDVETGEAAGYGATWRASRPTRLAVVAVGYDDGLPWLLSNKGEILVRGVACPIVGRVMMDYTLVDVTDAPPSVAPGEIVTALGRDGAGRLTVEGVAARAGLLPYAVTCGLGRRLGRVALGESATAVPATFAGSGSFRRARSV